MLIKIKILFCYLIFLGLSNAGCSVAGSGGSEVKTEARDTTATVILKKGVIVGAERMEAYLPKLLDGQIAMVVNQTSRVGERHLVDTLLKRGVQVKRIFAPEHGFRGDADAGQQVADGKDVNTGIEIISLYGKKKKPFVEELKNINWLVFDLQDVGARFYTYISSLHYVMEACAEQGVKLLVLDRPNPNGHYVDGPVLEKGFESFVGMHPVPVVYGLTIAEYARMINGEGWLADGKQCELHYVLCENYDHNTSYKLPVKPSPNLPNMRAIYLYPSLCFFEGTVVSVGRGTDKQFQVFGHPDATVGDYTFTPRPMPGASHPLLEGKLCKGFDLSNMDEKVLSQQSVLKLDYLIQFYTHFPDKEKFFLKNNFFDKLAGNSSLRTQIQAGRTEAEIRQSWQQDLEGFKKVRAKYLCY